MAPRATLGNPCGDARGRGRQGDRAEIVGASWGVVRVVCIVASQPIGYDVVFV